MEHLYSTGFFSHGMERFDDALAAQDIVGGIWDDLTPRQQQVAFATMSECPVTTIATALDISPRGVYKHRDAIKKKAIKFVLSQRYLDSPVSARDILAHIP